MSVWCSCPSVWYVCVCDCFCVCVQVCVGCCPSEHACAVCKYLYVTFLCVCVCVCMLVSPMGWCSQARSQNSSMQLMNRHVFVLHVCVTAPVRTRSWQLQHFLTNIYRSPGFYQVQQVNHFLFQGMAQPCPFSRA